MSFYPGNAAIRNRKAEVQEFLCREGPIQQYCKKLQSTCIRILSFEFELNQTDLNDSFEVRTLILD